MNYFDLDSQTEDLSFSSADANEKDLPKWVQSIENVAQGVSKLTDYGASSEGVGLYEKEPEKKGEKTKKFGLDPLVFIGVSFALIIATTVAVIVISRKQSK